MQSVSRGLFGRVAWPWQRRRRRRPSKMDCTCTREWEPLEAGAIRGCVAIDVILRLSVEGARLGIWRALEHPWLRVAGVAHEMPSVQIFNFARKSGDWKCVPEAKGTPVLHKVDRIRPVPTAVSVPQSTLQQLDSCLALRPTFRLRPEGVCVTENATSSLAHAPINKYLIL